MLRLTPLILLGACVPDHEPEDWQSWYGPMGELGEDVTEEVLFTDAPYTAEMYTGGIAGLSPLMQDFTRKYAPGDDSPVGCDGWQIDGSLPREFWAMVTLHPRLYYKGTGCTPNPAPRHPVTNARLDSEEKYYGNFFVEDDSGGIFVLNDSKVAHFEMGDRVKLRVRGVGERFTLESIVSHDVIEVDRGPHPISWTPAGETTCSGVSPTFDPTDPAQLAEFADLDVECAYDDPTLIGRVLRAEGIVLSLPDTFGAFHVYDDQGFVHQVSLDSELNRRKWSYPIGSRIQATGPVLNSFGNSIIIMKVGQVQVLEE